ncbi:MAG: DUF2283 domain-containing protein [Chloroflexota bacterium]|nr:DUF2283 domain-containing protein [Chloroflexota bacterium]
MELRYDPEADAIYVALREHEGQVRSRNAGDWRRVVDYDETGEPVGVELLAVSAGVDLEGLPDAEAIGEAIRSFPRLGTRP